MKNDHRRENGLFPGAQAWNIYTGRPSIRLLARGGVALLLAMLLLGTSSVSGHRFDGGGGGHGDAGGGSSFIPTFQAAPCPFTLGAGLVEGQQVSCGFVTVLLNRQANTGAKVKLAIALFRAPEYMHSIDPAPVLRLEGGPGYSALDASAHVITAQNYRSILFHHDLILFDQRGVGYSTPSLACPEVDGLATTVVAMQVRAAHLCHDRLVAEGIDLNSFTTLQNAADIADLIHALGYQQMTLYSDSYGTRLALTVMRLYPEVVRAAVLDSVYPLNHNRNELPSAAQRAFTALFQHCAADPDCNAKYPDLRNVLNTLVDELNAHPISLSFADPGTKQRTTISSYTGDQLIAALYNDFYRASTIAWLPLTIYQVKAQAYAQLSALSSSARAGLLSWGMFYSIECSEDWPFLTQQDIMVSRQGVAPQIARVLGNVEQKEYNVCQFWKVQAVPLVQKQPVHSSLPALVLSGEYDPITPPANGQEVARDLSHSYYFHFPNAGHAVQYTSDCADQIISAFEDSPSQKPDGACIARIGTPAFQ